MHSNFNRQFIMLDFRLLENREFLRFIGSSQYATYLVLRRYIWRSQKPHYMGLHGLYRQKHLLASSVDRDKIAEIIGVERANVSRHLTALDQRGVIQRISTGRQNIYVLGEWIDVHNKGPGTGVEWFYLDGVFGITKDSVAHDGGDLPEIEADVTPSDTSDVAKRPRQKRRPASPLRRRPASHNNREGNREENTVTNGDLVKQLPDLDSPDEEQSYLAQHMAEQLDDSKSQRFYKLVAAKIPKDVIWQALGEIAADGAQHPARVFTHRMGQHALKRLKQAIGK